MNGYWKDFWGSRWRRSNPYGAPGPTSVYTKGYHRGEDIANGGNTADVPTLRAGEVIDSGRSGVIGHWLCVLPDGAPDERDIYCHMYEPSTIESGHVSAGDILGRTAGWGESPGSGWSGPHLHFVVSNRSDGGYNTSRADYDPNPRIDAALAAETPLAPNERRSTGSRARREATSASEKADDGYLDPGTKWAFNEFTRGESVDGNNVWFKGPNSGLYYWSGSFEGGADTTGLREIGAPPVASNQRTVTGDGVYERTGPGTSYAKTGREFPAGEVLDFKAWTHGEPVSLNGVTTDVWYQGAYSDNWFSAACFTSQSTDGLPKVTFSPPVVTPPPVATPPDATVPEWKKRIPDSPLAKWVGSPNFNYREPRPATEPPTHVTMHWMAGTLAGTDAEFQKTDPGAAATYGVGQTEIHQYVREIDYQQADGDQNSNRWGLSVEHEAGPSMPATASVKALSARLLADIATRHGWSGYSLYSGDVEAFRKTPDAEQLAFLKKSVADSPKTRLVFPHKAWASTSCPGTLPLSEIVALANTLLRKEAPPVVVPPVAVPPVVVPTNPDDQPVTVGWLKQLFEAIVTAVRAFFGSKK